MFFVNYLLSVSLEDMVRGEHSKARGEEHQVNGESEVSLSQKVWLVLCQLLGALSDRSLNQQLDGVVAGRL
jgi:environmental stress-induced protein Ves